MKSLLCNLFVFGIALTGLAGPSVGFAEDKPDDMKLIAGTWTVTEMVINGHRVPDKELEKLRVVNGADGTWALLVEGKEISRGTNIFDSTQTPKTLDFYPTDGEGKDNQYLGIYELDENARKICFSLNGKPRPQEFSAAAESERVLMTFEKAKTE
jgi:uncharacterized protein (TIGR03067 family)